MKAKNKTYINNIKVICEADIRNGRLKDTERALSECILIEDYETAHGVSMALKK